MDIHTTKTGVEDYFIAEGNSQDISLNEDNGLRKYMQCDLILEKPRRRIYIKTLTVVNLQDRELWVGV